MSYIISDKRLNSQMDWCCGERYDVGMEELNPVCNSAALLCYHYKAYIS